MRYIFLLALVLTLQVSFSQELDSVSCSEFSDYEGIDLNRDVRHLSEYELYILASEINSDVKQISWKWEELGPTDTPEESEVSRALPKYSLNRGNGTGRINNLYINPENEKQVFACSPTGGLFYSKDRGENWKNGGTDNLLVSGVSGVSVNPRNSRNWIISTGDGDDTFIFSSGVYRTFNKGKVWEQINGNGEFQLPVSKKSTKFYISEVVSHPCSFNIQFLATNKGLFKCNNAMQAASEVLWRKVSSEKFYDIEISPKDPNRIIAGGENIWLSEDCGNEWRKIERPPLDKDEKYGLTRLSVEWRSDLSDTVEVIITRKKALGKGGIGDGFLYSLDLASGNWKMIRSLKSVGNVIPSRAGAFERSPTNDSLFLIGNVSPVRRSLNMGKDFEKIASNQMHDDIHDFEFFSDGKTVLASTDGGVSKSLDGGLTWKKSDFGIGAANVHGISVAQIDGDQVLYGAYDTGCTLLKNDEWKHVSFGDGFQTITHADSSDLMIVTMQNGRLYEASGEEGFQESIKMRGAKSSWHTWVKANSEYPEVLYHSGVDINRTMDFGKTWEVILNADSVLGTGLKAWRFFQTDGFPNEMFVAVIGESRKYHKIFYSKNINEKAASSVTWTEIPRGNKNAWLTTVINDKACETCCYMGYGTYSDENKIVYYNGDTLEDVSLSLGYSQIKSGIRDKHSSIIYLGTKEGIFVKKPNDNTWIILTGLPGARITSMDINYVTEELYIGTFGRGVWKGKLLKFK